MTLRTERTAMRGPLPLGPLAIGILSMSTTAFGQGGDGPAKPGKAVLVLHGGAGAPSRQELTKEQEGLYRADLERALQAGYAELKQGKSSLDAVVAAVVILEDSPHFNAGKGAVFTHEGRN